MKNLHLQHIDEALYENGVEGAHNALEAIHNILNGKANISTKVDGAPAVFAGYDPKDKQFFVGTKAVFAKNAKLCKSMADIDKHYEGGLNHKLKECLKHLPNIGIPFNTVLQGDLLWTEGEQMFETINGKRYVTVHPNTLVYAWEANSEMGKRVVSRPLGIAFHTTYTGNGSLSEYRAHFGANTGGLASRNVFITDVKHRQELTFTEAERTEIKAALAEAESHIKNFDRIVEVMNMIPKSYVGAGIKSFVNNCVRKDFYPSESFGFNQYVSFVNDYWNDKVIPSVVTEAAKLTKKAGHKQLRRELEAIREDIEASFAFIKCVKEAKDLVLSKLNSSAMQESFVKTESQTMSTPPEGYVIATESAVMKLVDRLTFSRINFSEEYIKGWQKK